ncbi:YccS family putative transporter [Variovorax sp. VNK109]|uniref:YccS family putative transporter n=1 Tax=Variovorax sp. VNK109 TaxID=3400919 RepID=UPI003BFDDEB0
MPASPPVTHPSSVRQLLGRLWALSAFAYSLRVFIALTAIMAVCWHTGEMAWLMPLFLGAIASAISETDDGWRGRLRAVGVTLVCFAAAAFSVQWLMPHVPLFALGLVASTLFFVMLGAVGPRYQAMGYATLILSIYTAISMEQHALRGNEPLWIEPVLLVAGAAWYGLLSVLWASMFVHQPVQQALARLYLLLGDYLHVKASLLEPVRGLDVERRRLSLAQINGNVVRELNFVKESLFSRLRATRNPRTSRYLRLYFLAQDIHERASSSHYAYDELTEAFFHSDALFRAQRALRISGDDCGQLAEAIRLRVPFVKSAAGEQAMEDFRASIAWLMREPADAQRSQMIDTLRALAKNLSRLDAQIAIASRPPADTPAATVQTDQSLLDRSPRNAREAWDRVRLQLNSGAPLFRHAVRLSIALLAGYLLIHSFPSPQGYWILLTTLFVCQPGYGATRRRVTERVTGTFAGLVIGWAVLELFPEPLIQAAFAVFAGVVFFALRQVRYALATAAMTLLVLLAANQVTDGYELIIPRMVDTLLGSVIASIAVFAILPDWQSRRMHEVAARALAANRDYLRALLTQYRDGPRDDLPFRLARRNAHNADAALSAAIAGMLREPGFLKREGDDSVRLLVLSHTVLAYLSGLGAHRDKLPGGEMRDLALAAGQAISDELDAIAQPLARGQAPIPLTPDQEAEGRALLAQLRQDNPTAPESQRLMLTQLSLLARQMPLVRRSATSVAPDAPHAAVAAVPQSPS